MGYGLDEFESDDLELIIMDAYYRRFVLTPWNGWDRMDG